jgi:hypothetical protein
MLAQGYKVSAQDSDQQTTVPGTIVIESDSNGRNWQALGN